MKVFVPGGAGYKGSVLVPRLLSLRHEVVVYDLYIYGQTLKPHPNLTEIKGDVRNINLYRNAADGCEAAIHLACISNDPSCDLDPALAKSINLDSFPAQIDACKEAGIKRFIYASSASVYGISNTPDVREDAPRVPITDYNKYKALCEDILAAKANKYFHFVSVRPGTICGYSPRLRLDLLVNNLCARAFFNRKIVLPDGGIQHRPNLHINDVTYLYCDLLTEPLDLISGQAFNASYTNKTILEIAQEVKDIFDSVFAYSKLPEIEIKQSDDRRSYQLNNSKIIKALGFLPQKTIKDASIDLFTEFPKRHIAYGSSNHFNTKKMQEIGLK